MRILIVNKFLYPNGGSETYIFEIGNMLRKMGHEVQYFGMEHEGRIVGNRIDCYTSNMDFHHAGVMDKLKYPFQIIWSREAEKKMTAVLRDFQPDVVHFNNINFQLTPSVIEAVHRFDPQIRMVYTAHDYQWVCPNHMLKIPETGELCERCIDGDYSACTQNRCVHGSYLRSLLGAREGKYYRKRETYHLVDTVICPSRFMEQVLQHHPAVHGRTVVIHNFLPEDSGETSVSSERTRNYVLYFGRYDQEKGIRTALSAARALPEIPFVFAGKGELEQEVKEAADSCSNITNMGFLRGEKLKTTIQNAAFSIFPSEWYENCPFTVVESQLNGTPILASDLGGTPELVLPGKTGETFRPGNAEILKDRIHGLWKDPKRLRQYQDNCLMFHEEAAKELGLLSLREYCEKLELIYSGK